MEQIKALADNCHRSISIWNTLNLKSRVSVLSYRNCSRNAWTHVLAKQASRTKICATFKGSCLINIASLPFSRLKGDLIHSFKNTYFFHILLLRYPTLDWMTTGFVSVVEWKRSCSQPYNAALDNPASRERVHPHGSRPDPDGRENTMGAFS